MKPPLIPFVPLILKGQSLLGCAVPIPHFLLPSTSSESPLNSAVGAHLWRSPWGLRMRIL